MHFNIAPPLIPDNGNNNNDKKIKKMKAKTQLCFLNTDTLIMTHMRPTTGATLTTAATRNMAQRAIGSPKPQQRSRFVKGLTAVVSLALTGCGAGAAGGIFGGAAVVAGGIWGVRNLLLRRKISSPGFVDALIEGKDWETIGKFLTSYPIGKKHRGNLQRALMEEGTRENLPPLTLAAIVLARGDKELSEEAYVALEATARKSDDFGQALAYVDNWLRRYDQLKAFDMRIASLKQLPPKILAVNERMAETTERFEKKFVPLPAILEATEFEG